MDTSTSSEELDSSLEIISEDQTLLTAGSPAPHRPSPFTLRSRCSSERCPHGTGIQFRSRISPSPSKHNDDSYMETRSGNRYHTYGSEERVRHRRRRRSDQHRHSVTTDSSSFLELSHENGRAGGGHVRVLHENGHVHHHQHQDTSYPHDGIHNIDHHHVHVLQQDQQRQQLLQQQTSLVTYHLGGGRVQDYLGGRVQEPLLKQAEVRVERLHPGRGSYLSALDYPSPAPAGVTKADLLFEEMQREEERRRRRARELKKEKTVTTSETTTTKVRRNILDTSDNGGPQVGMNGGVAGLAETVKNTVIGFLTPPKEKARASSVVESSESGFEDGSVFGEKTGTSGTNEPFRPAREFFDENDTRERLNSGYCSGSDTPSRLRESTRRLSIRKPFNKYIAYSSDEEYEDWQEQPKSDYTYSASITYRRRVTPDRKIGSPNMSRRTLKGGTIGYVRTSEFSAADDAASHTWDLRSRTIHKAMDALSDTSDGEETLEQQQQQQELFQNRNRRSTRSRSIDVPKSNGSVSRTVTTTSMEYSTTRTLHLGLDVESDVDDGTESAVPDRATPLLGRGGTPLGRAMTPLKLSSSRKSSSASVDGGKGFKIGEGTIAEDVEEEEEKDQENAVWRWSRKTVNTITRITTIITASIAMMAARAVTASSSSSEKIEKEEKSSSMSTLEVITTKYQAFCDRLRKNPILLWIPLLFILLLLALATYWWLLQSHGKTAGASDQTTENDGPSSSFLFLFFALVRDLTMSVVSGISSFFAYLGSSITTNTMGLISLCQTGVTNGFESVVAGFLWLGTNTLSLFSWLWSWIVVAFTYLLKLPILLWELVSNVVLGIYSFLSSSATYLYGFIPFIFSKDPSRNETSIENNTFSIVAWVANLSPAERLNEAYVTVVAGTQSSGTLLWNAWMWLVLGLGDLFTALASYVAIGLSSLWAAIVYGLSGIWSVLKFVWLALASILWTAATFVSALAPNTSALYASTEKNIVIQSSANVANVSYPKIEEIVQQVLESEKLKNIIAAAVAENSEGRVTVEEVYAAAKSVVESELGVVKADISALKTEVHVNAAAAAEHHKKILQLHDEKANLINELGELGQRLYNIEGKLEAVDAKSIEDHHDIEEQIKQLLQQINKLEMDHTNLAAEVKTCCDDKKIPAMLADIFGLTLNGTSDTGKQDIGAWMKNYFVAKDELNVKLNELMSAMQLKPDDDATQATISQTTQMVMGTVLLKLQEEMSKQQQQFSVETQQAIQGEVSSQVQAAAEILRAKVTEDLAQEVEANNEQLKGSLKENVNSAVLEQVGAAVETAVSNAVDVAVKKAVLVEIEKSVPEAVKDILPSMVSEEVSSSVPAIVAATLPGAVTAAVTEAMVHVKQGSGKNEIVGVTGSASVNISHDGGDTTMFVPGMHFSGGLNETQVLKIVQDALRKYDADKTGMVDHALESAGGYIVSTRCTESYQVHQAELWLLGFPFYRYSTNNPRTVIQPETMPGQCWAFKGSQGYIVIQLAGNVKPTGFTLEHIPKSLSPNGAIDSAPRGFEVWGLFSEKDEGVFLGTYEYLENGEPLQYFPVETEVSEYFPLIELKINSNHGNLQYTCLYRFRVHGVRLL
ncbi:uncharacterized protein LOC135197276 isoform X2 [Macrobrachium nipponense]|uniref:uncharacterized protein LOC135197276 isoform X2 n=1 Tax=Macrobrachium nipponense TaxID=159736 RepID=UPI0030C82C6B